MIGYIALDVPEGLQDCFTVMKGQSVAYQKVSDGIDVAPNRTSAEFCSLADCCSAAHERVKDSEIFHAHGAVKRAEDIGARWSESTESDCSEDGAKALRPPFVNVVDRPIDFLPPALDFGDIADGLKRKIIILQRARADKRRENVISVVC